MFMNDFSEKPEFLDVQREDENGRLAVDEVQHSLQKYGDNLTQKETSALLSDVTLQDGKFVEEIG